MFIQFWIFSSGFLLLLGKIFVCALGMPGLVSFFCYQERHVNARKI